MKRYIISGFILAITGLLVVVLTAHPSTKPSEVQAGLNCVASINCKGY